jgi:hypothetical protein
VYEIITETAHEYTERSREVVGTFESLQEANMKAAEVLLFDGFYTPGDEPTYEVERGGGLRIGVTADGSTSRRVAIYVKSAAARQILGPMRR